MAGNNGKIIFFGETLIDLTGDTVTADKVLKGYTTHDKAGDPITGTCSYDADTSSATATDAEILKDKTAVVRGATITGAMPNNGAVSGSISTKAGSYTIPQGYHDGSGKVSIDSDSVSGLSAINVRQGITILGITGSMSGSEDVKAQTKTVTPTTSEQVINPDTGYNYLSSVTVSAVSVTKTLNSAGGYTVTIG